MKRQILTLLVLIGLTLPTFGAAPRNEKPFTLPEVQQWQGGKGTFTPTSADDARITYRLKADRRMPADGYTIAITAKGIAATAPTEQGLAFARTTVAQLMERSADGSLPCGTIRDWPRYRLRGFMLDCGRKFIPMHTLYDVVDLMAYYKMNTLQLHLNDNGFRQYFNNDWASTPAAFRLECDTYPGLAAADGYYTKKEFIALQEYAAGRGVEIIPEIDVPAHDLAFTHYRPDLGSDEFGMDHLNLRNPDVYPFIDALFREYLEGDEPVFRGPRVNIGTDEYSNRDSVVVEEFRRFTDHYIRYIESYGKQAVLWGSLTHAKGVTPVKVEGVLMNCWSDGYANPAEMKELGYQLVSIPDGYVYIVPAAGYYYDYLNCQFLYEHWTPAQMGGTKLEEGDPCVEGGMFAVWNDHIGNGISTADIMDRVYPAMQTIAAKTWSADRVTYDYAAFDSLRHTVGSAIRQQALGIGWPFRLSFDIDEKPEEPGTVLLYDDDTRLFLADPIRGQLGFSRDGYLYTFNYRVESGRHTIAIEATSTGTRLVVDGRVRETLQRRWRYYGDKGGARMAEVPTLMLHWPAQMGNCRSTISNLNVSRQ